MGQIKTRIQTSKPESQFDKVLEQALLNYTVALSGLLNGGLKFEDNFNCQIVDVADTGAANTLFAVAHTLKRVPIGFLVANVNKAGIIYDSGTAWTETNIYLKCSVANAAVKLIVI